MNTNVTTKIETVTPELATDWLVLNRRNRRVDERVVSGYVRDMKQGKWSLTGEAIKFSAEGDLLDGQHRLYAIIRSGVSIQSVVVRGLDQEAQHNMDVGKKRTAGDDLSINGYKYAHSLAAAARVGLMWTTGTFNDVKSGVTSSEIRAYVDGNPGLIDSVATAVSFRSRLDVPASAVAFAHYRLSQISPEDADDFFSSMADSRTNGVGDPRLALMNKFRDIRISGRRVTAGIQLQLIFQSWNKWRMGKEQRIIQLNKVKYNPSMKLY